LDLTEGMKEEEFADGMTEELIDKLSKVPGLKVPSATSAFYFKGKQVPVAEMAKALGVVYLVDGSVRKSGEQLRIAARLLRADSGYVVWTETYDRPFVDRVKIQDEIAGEVTKALERQWRVGVALRNRVQGNRVTSKGRKPEWKVRRVKTHRFGGGNRRIRCALAMSSATNRSS